MDALAHFGAVEAVWNGTDPFPVEQVKYYGGHNQAAVKPDPNGMLAKLGIDKAAPIARQDAALAQALLVQVTTAVLLDAQRFIGNGKPLEAGYAVTAGDIASAGRIETRRLLNQGPRTRHELPFP
jgi:hypothetical protein